MKQKHLITLALVGAAAGLLIGSCAAPQKRTCASPAAAAAPVQNGTAMSSDTQSFYLKLSPVAQATFDLLDAKHQNMAVMGMGKSKDANASVMAAAKDQAMANMSAPLSASLQSFFNQLSPDAQALFQLLNPAHQMMAMTTASGGMDPSSAVVVAAKDQLVGGLGVEPQVPVAPAAPAPAAAAEEIFTATCIATHEVCAAPAAEESVVE